MIHGLSRTKSKQTACGLRVTSRKDQWEHPLASDGGPLTTYPVCVNCSACLEAGAGYAAQTLARDASV